MRASWRIRSRASPPASPPTWGRPSLSTTRAPVRRSSARYTPPLLARRRTPRMTYRSLSTMGPADGAGAVGPVGEDGRTGDAGRRPVARLRQADGLGVVERVDREELASGGPGGSVRVQHPDVPAAGGELERDPLGQQQGRG